MGELSKQVGRRIKQIRESRGIKQCALAEFLNMEPSNLTRIESGYQMPKEENLCKIAAILNVEIKDLFDFSQNLSKDVLMQKIISVMNELDNTQMEFVYNFIKLYNISKQNT